MYMRFCKILLPIPIIYARLCSNNLFPALHRAVSSHPDKSWARHQDHMTATLSDHYAAQTLMHFKPALLAKCRYFQGPRTITWQIQEAPQTFATDCRCHQKVGRLGVARAACLLGSDSA